MTYEVAATDVIRWKDVALGLYFMDAGGIIAMHQHTWEHTICLLAGEGEIEIAGSGITKMEMAKNYVLPANIDHEIRALQNGTIMVGMTDDRSLGKPAQKGRDGGVMLHDGTIVYETN